MVGVLDRRAQRSSHWNEFGQDGAERTWKDKSPEGEWCEIIPVQVQWMIRRDRFQIVGTACYKNHWFVYFDGTKMPHKYIQTPNFPSMCIRTNVVRVSTKTWAMVLWWLWIRSSAQYHCLTCARCPLQPMPHQNYEMEHRPLLPLVEIISLSAHYAFDNIAYI